ncbi:hypothetical protein ED312_10210 [Sinomicrobium pectinilyticum]|uniref:Uncharacterized protein n=1 Tax=Sinomicrobium pectinilyticum TaxID=1084421 RepID=A0A3N0EHH8_SINP1|nr:hypothetical protein [Sinomicrobium pectinilyticum]RNL87177.1 hypothetical protein ED312_10210 [Sinomicrobium pectinilyticum]
MQPGRRAVHADKAMSLSKWCVGAGRRFAMKPTGGLLKCVHATTVRKCEQEGEGKGHPGV